MAAWYAQLRGSLTGRPRIAVTALLYATMTGSKAFMPPTLRRTNNDAADTEPTCSTILPVTANAAAAPALTRKPRRVVCFSGSIVPSVMVSLARQAREEAHVVGAKHLIRPASFYAHSLGFNNVS